VYIDIPCRNPLVRDLSWALSSPPLLQRDDPGVRWPDSEWFLELGQDYHKQLEQLDTDPQPLRRLIDSQKDRRIGNYFENLWRYWLQDNDRYELLFANLPVRSAQRTIGEFDLLVRDRQTGKTLHWELAVKFYLGVGDTTRPANWWGPSRHDRLDLKTDRLLQHQTRLALHPQSRQLLSELGLKIDETWLIVKGRLFYPSRRAATAPRGAGNEHLRGFWMTADTFASEPESYWLPLSRQQWLAPVTQVDPALCRDTTALAKPWNITPLAQPLCVARIDRGMEVARGFIVPDDWAQHIDQLL
jgi:hypothetical protein